MKVLPAKVIAQKGFRVITIGVVKVVLFPKTITIVIFGANHNHIHRFTVGTILMFLGVKLGKAEIGPEIFHSFFELCGGCLHAMGFAPFLDSCAELAKTEEQKTKAKLEVFESKVETETVELKQIIHSEIVEPVEEQIY